MHNLDIPTFLRVQNRKPLTPEQAARVEAIMAEHTAEAKARTENWRVLEAQRIAARKQKNRERGALLRILYGNGPRKTRTWKTKARKRRG